MKTRRPHSKAWIAALVTLGALAGCGADSPPPSGPVVASVLTAADAAVPGKPFTVGWRLVPDEGWYLYTNGLSDSGLPPEVRLDLPAGWTAGPLQWPAGQRHEAPGGLLDHVYEDEVVLLQTLHVPDGQPLGDDAVVKAALSWLACREGCVPGDTTLTVAVPIASRAVPTDAATTLASVVLGLPRAPRQGEVDGAWDGDVFAVRVPGAARLEFHPAADCGALVDVRADAAADADRLELRFRPRDGALGPARGVLAVDRDGARLHLSLDVPSTNRGDR